VHIEGVVFFSIFLGSFCFPFPGMLIGRGVIYRISQSLKMINFRKIIERSFSSRMMAFLKARISHWQPWQSGNRLSTYWSSSTSSSLLRARFLGASECLTTLIFPDLSPLWTVSSMTRYAGEMNAPHNW